MIRFLADENFNEDTVSGILRLLQLVDFIGRAASTL